MASANYLDIALIVILALFALLSFLRGFIKDFFSTLNLILASIISYFLNPIIVKFIVKNSTISPIIIDVASGFIIFIALITILSIITSRVSKPLSEVVPGAIDQSLGFAFGLSKGYFLVAFTVAVVISFYDLSPNKDADKNLSKMSLIKKEKLGPNWLRQAKSYDILSFGVNLIEPFIDNIILQTKDNIAGQPKDDDGVINQDAKSIGDIIKAKKLYDNAASPDDNSSSDNPASSSDNAADNTDSGGYTKQEVDKMKRLMDIMAN